MGRTKTAEMGELSNFLTKSKTSKRSRRSSLDVFRAVLSDIGVDILKWVFWRTAGTFISMIPSIPIVMRVLKRKVLTGARMFQQPRLSTMSRTEGGLNRKHHPLQFRGESIRGVGTSWCRKRGAGAAIVARAS